MKYLNALKKIDGVGSKRMFLLMNHFGDSEKIWKASRSELLASRIPERIANLIISERSNIDPDKEWEMVQMENITVISINDPCYPELLQQIPDKPYLLYMKGNLDCLKMPLIAIVGSRKITTYGERVARSFSRDLANNGICVVSGLAFGVDAASHRGALDAKGKTIAVLGNSLDDQSISPRTNLNLSREILDAGGLLISEFPIRTNGDRFTFPMRNRIMAGISQAILVVEAAFKSGSLITADLAIDYNRDVFAIPGQIFSTQSEGTNQLIKSGAKLTTCAKDILEELRIENPSIKEQIAKQVNLCEKENTIYQKLSNEGLHIDIIARLTKLDTSTISSTLAILEIKGLVKNIGGQNYIRI